MPIWETILRKQGRELLQKWSKLSGKIRKVEIVPNPTAKKTETLAYGGERFGPCFIYLKCFVVAG
jgi:hypothetical protein